MLLCGGWVIGMLVGGRPRQLALESIPFAVVLALVVGFLLPNFEEAYLRADGTESWGIPIRGYGVMLFLGTVSAVWWSQQRAQRRGLEADVIYNLATWVIALGLLGARVFYVIEYWQDFQRPTAWETVREVFKVTQGGLVVYGSLIGGTLGFLIYAFRNRLPALGLLDIAAPTFMLGLAIGRIGCLLNGCCYGGLCEHAWAVRFPAASPAYAHQLSNGSLRGFEWQIQPNDDVTINKVLPDSPADRAGLQVGDVLVAVDGQPLVPSTVMAQLGQTDALETGRLPAMNLELGDKRTIQLEALSLPPRSQPVHPTQVYATINAALVCLLLICAEPLLNKTGQVTALLLTVYPVTRFLLEIIRQDEAAVASTAMTISQNVSVALLVLAVGLWGYLATRPSGWLSVGLPPRQGVS